MPVEFLLGTSSEKGADTKINGGSAPDFIIASSSASKLVGSGTAPACGLDKTSNDAGLPGLSVGETIAASTHALNEAVNNVLRPGSEMDGKNYICVLDGDLQESDAEMAFGIEMVIPTG